LGEGATAKATTTRVATAITTTARATTKTLGNHNRIKSNKMRENSASAERNSNSNTFKNRHALETLYQLKLNAKIGRECKGDAKREANSV